MNLRAKIDLMYRYLVLNHQFGVVTQMVDALGRRDRQQLLEIVTRRIDGVGSDGLGSAEAFARLRSSNSHIRMLALGAWLGAVFAETAESPDGDLQTLNKRVAGRMRLLRQSLPQADAARVA